MVEKDSSVHQGIAQLNSLSNEDAQAELLKCCGSTRWAKQMVAARPFAGVSDLNAKADQLWWSLNSEDWLEAFHSHPKIGEKKASASTSATAQKWSEEEQSGTAASDQDTLAQLAKLNSEYQEKFGFIFIVCASGKSSGEMLSILRDRMKNDPGEELRVAAAEQAKITELRLGKLLESNVP
jgi:OHCU decarboxylase